MDLKKTLHIHSRGKHKKGDTAQLAAQLAPLEELDKQAAVRQQPAIPPESPNGPTAADFGGIVVDNADLHVPRDILEGGDEKTFLGMEPVVLVILCLMLAFIGFIAWQISLMPPE